MGEPALSLVVPAHDEAGAIGSFLHRVADGDPAGVVEVVVVANGCRDDTAGLARAAHPRATVVEIAQRSKTAALNAGDAAATAVPRAYVDADVDVSVSTLLELARRLAADEHAQVASPRLVVDTRGASAAVRALYRVWELTEYRSRGHIGSGVYLLSAEGRRRFADFPDVVADDRFVQTRFPASERLTPTDLTFTVRSPRTLRAYLRRQTRIRAGNQQLRALGLTVVADAPGTAAGSLAGTVVRRPWLWADAAVYLAATVASATLARRALRHGAVEWAADRPSA